MTFTGKNPDFTVTWDCAKQTYFVYKSGKLLRKVFSFKEAKNYLN